MMRRAPSQCAVAMSLAGKALMKEVADGKKLGRTRVGLHFGKAIVGNFGGEGRIQYTALGDSMNVAARLEGANKQLKTAVLVSREAAERYDLDQSFGRWAGCRCAVAKPRSKCMNHWVSAVLSTIRCSPPFTRASIRATVRALDELQARSLGAPEDIALAYLVKRLEQVGPGGSHELD